MLNLLCTGAIRMNTTEDFVLPRSAAKLPPYLVMLYFLMV